MDQENKISKTDVYQRWAYCFTALDMVLNSGLAASVGDSVYPLLHNTHWELRWLMAYYEHECIDEEILRA